ncbi:hypothetical protein Zm00014a_015192 [Zea mays]|nr:uncharacterized protein LOC100276201 precursor [Zea mays]AQK69251.1 hypothetical protein ZEAMMB73_Zm00001d015654 [Zea mays]PWZ22483.1 hypothetical protein Zm00014a_015192 [Zea mays]
MRRQLKCVGLLLLLSLLLPALSPVVVVATARRELLPLMATGDEGRPQDVSSSGTWMPPGAAEEAVVRRKDEAMKTNGRRFRRTSSWNWKKMPAAASQVSFGGRIPFTADYHSVHRHPPTHN